MSLSVSLGPAPAAATADDDALGAMTMVFEMKAEVEATN
jgi:hypothetical protein